MKMDLQLIDSLPREIVDIILSHHPLFTKYTRVYQLIKYLNGIFQERQGLNRDLFYSGYLGNPYYRNYEIMIYRYNPFCHSKKKRCFIIHQVDLLREGNCGIQ